MSTDTHHALVALGRWLAESGYRFTTVTPETHRRVNARAPILAANPRDVFGWSRPFGRGTLPDAVVDLLRAAGALHVREDGFASAVRFSTLGPHLFVHSAHPTVEADAVFFGPDTYRFCAAIRRAGVTAERVADIGCGSGAGGIVAGLGAARLVLADVNDRALCHARVNLELAGAASEQVQVLHSDILAAVTGQFDLIVANPPYMKDEQGRAYRDGGGAHGAALSVRIVAESLGRLAPGGTLLLYTGVACIGGDDPFWRVIAPLFRDLPVAVTYEELDPDVFGEELDRPGYEAVERIAAVVLTVRRR